ncbi:hypothetical protein M6B38_404585 [Iris pallida]|uniref:Secreted protein n=1 Tax=Iris pallida TaxID=29817 RepID=A0AAX6FRC5_IRIPA|nr:hypothetical protein M6B38_404585 [Iris pallida]
MLGGQRFITFLFSIFQIKASTPTRTLYSVYLPCFILTRCTHDCSLFIVHHSSFIVQYFSLLVHWVGKYYRYVTNPILARH